MGRTQAERRLEAAAASGGVSVEAVYGLFERVVAELPSGLRDGDLLDFGAGTGTLARRLAQAGRRRVTGCDLMGRPADLPPAVAWHQGDLNEPLALPAASFDVIVAAEVIEHLENPRAVAREWFRLLRPGGYLLASTPNNESLRALLALVFRGHFVHFLAMDYPAHITALLRLDLARVLVEAGFEDPTFRYSGEGLVPKLTRARWQQVSSRLGGVRFSDNLMVVARVSSAKRPAVQAGNGRL